MMRMFPWWRGRLLRGGERAPAPGAPVAQGAAGGGAARVAGGPRRAAHRADAGAVASRRRQRGRV